MYEKVLQIEEQYLLCPEVQALVVNEYSKLKNSLELFQCIAAK